jgi:hypothetical protein
VLRKAVNVGEAVSERLQAFVYEDVKTNKTLLTIRNVGSTGSEVEYLMAVGYDGNVLKEVRLAETIRLGTQQAYTTYLSKLLGSEFDNYTDVKPRMAVLYLKTVKGGVFGSAYIAPPSVMTAAYATSTTTISTTETSTEQLIVPSYETTITSWTATVVISNPDHWPVDTYVGAAFMRQQPTSISFGWSGGGHGTCTVNWANWLTPGMTGFPAWGLQPNLIAVDQNDNLRTVSLNDIFLPKYVATIIRNSGSYTGWCLYSGSASWKPVLMGVGVARFTRLGPTYIAAPDGEKFEPRMMMPRLIFSTIFQTYYSTSTSVYRTCSFNRSSGGLVCEYYQTTRTIPTATSTFTSTNDVRDNQNATFPYKIVFETAAKVDRYECLTPWDCYERIWRTYWLYYRTYYRLSYIKVVDMWNTTNVIAYATPSTTGDVTIQVKADRPLGIAAMYIYDSTQVTPPPPAPPPPPPEPPGKNVYGPALCLDKSAENKGVRYILELKEVPEGSPPPDSYKVTFYMPPGSNCQGYIVPGSGTYDASQLTACTRDGDTVTCTVPHGQVATAGCSPGS